MNQENTTSITFGDNKDTWRIAAIASGFALLISLAAHVGGPAAAHASPSANPVPNQLAIQHLQAQQTLSVGGFDTAQGQPAFIILNEHGQRVGTLPMNAASTQP